MSTFVNNGISLQINEYNKNNIGSKLEPCGTPQAIWE